MKIGQKVVITEEGFGHYLKPLTIGTIVAIHGAMVDVQGQPKRPEMWNNRETICQVLVADDYELIPEEEENEA